MSYSKINWAYLTPQTADRFNQMEENSVRLAEHKIVGCEVDITGNDTAIVAGGRLELNGDWLYRDGLTTTGMALTASEASAWYSASGGYIATSTAWYIVAYKDSGNSFSCKYRLSAPAYSDTLSGTSTGPKRYDKTGTTWLRYIGEVRNYSGGTFIHYKQMNDEIQYLNAHATALAYTLGATSTLTEISLVNQISPMTRAYRLTCSRAGGGAISMSYWGSTGSVAGNSGIHLFLNASNIEEDIGWHTMVTGSSYARSVYFQGAAATVSGNVIAVRLNR